MNLSDVQTGDTFLFRGGGFVSNVICNVMKVYGQRHGYNTDKLYSHAARAVWIAGKLYLFGSIDSGYKPWLFALHYDWGLDNFVIMRRKRLLSQKETNQTTHYCMHLNTVNLLYQYMALIWWLIYVYLRIDLFKKTSDDWTYCYRAELMARADLDPDNYKQLYRVDLFMLLYDPYYEVIYSSRP